MTRSRPKVSVVLPFYNARKTLEAALQSISAQDFPDFECILVDNNSADGSHELAARWERLDPRFRLVGESRQGVVFASNKGCDLAAAEYIARMDADDVARPVRLGLQSRFLDAHPEYGAVAGLVRHVGDPAMTGGFKRFVKWSNSLVSYEKIYLRRFIEAPIVNPTAMWRRTTMEQHGGYRSGDFPEDYEMWLRWLDRGVKMAKVPEVVLDWHDSPGRLTRSDPIYSEAAFYGIKSRYLAKWLAENNRFHPSVAVWGASRISRRRAKILEEQGIRIDRFIDTKTSRQLEQELVYYEDLPGAGSMFILSYVRQRENRDRIQRFLEARGYEEGRDYLLIS